MKLKNRALQELYDTLVSAGVSMSPYADSPVYEAFRECDEKLSDSFTFAQIKDLQDRCDMFEESNGTLLGANLDLATKKRRLEKDLDDAKKNVEYFRHSRDDWKSRAKHAENEVEELKATLEEANTDRTELQNDRNFYHDLYAELRKDYDKLFNNYKKKCEDIWELKSRPNSIYGKGPDYEDCFNAMIDGFETVESPYLGRPSIITIQYNPDCFYKED